MQSPLVTALSSLLSVKYPLVGLIRDVRHAYFWKFVAYSVCKDIAEMLSTLSTIGNPQVAGGQVSGLACTFCYVVLKSQKVITTILFQCNVTASHSLCCLRKKHNQA